MSDGTDVLTPDAAIAMLVDGEDVHTFVNPNGMLVGADWTRESVVAAIREAGCARLTGPLATQMGHGIVIEHNGRLVFLATKQSITGGSDAP